MLEPNIQISSLSQTIKSLGEWKIKFQSQGSRFIKMWKEKNKVKYRKKNERRINWMGNGMKVYQNSINIHSRQKKKFYN